MTVCRPRPVAGGGSHTVFCRRRHAGPGQKQCGSAVANLQLDLAASRLPAAAGRSNENASGHMDCAWGGSNIDDPHFNFITTTSRSPESPGGKGRRDVCLSTAPASRYTLNVIVQGPWQSHCQTFCGSDIHVEADRRQRDPEWPHFLGLAVQKEGCEMSDNVRSRSIFRVLLRAQKYGPLGPYWLLLALIEELLEAVC